MSPDPYSSCPCGSGKKFKWCCAPIHAEIDKAFRQQENGQHEAALQTIEDVVKAHPENAEAHGRKAQLLHINQRLEDAEKELEAAFAINPNYAFGYLLQGLFRQSEGEAIGAVLLFRKAAELYAHDAVEQLSFLYEQIADLELKRNHPVAARYALQRVARLQPENDQLQQAFKNLFGEESRIPEIARREYTLLGREPNRPSKWHDALASADSGRLGEAQKAFEEIGNTAKSDPLAWYNAGLLRAWLGDHKAALEALDKYVERETNEAKAVEAWALGEVLRLGDDAADQSDYSVYRTLMQFRDGNAVVGLLQEWEQAGRLIGVRSNQEDGMLSGLVLEQVQSLIGTATATYAPLAGYMLVAGDVFSVWHTKQESAAKLAEEVKQRLGAAVAQTQSFTTPPQFGDVVIEAMLFPMYGKVAGEVGEKMVERAQQYFEEEWAHRPLKSLAGNTPIDAAGSPVLRRKLLGDIEFLEQCLHGNSPRRGSQPVGAYDFSRLRHKLGVDSLAPTPAGPTHDFAAMSAADLAGVDVEPLSAEELEKAYRAAVGLDAGELAGKFVRTLVSRPADPAKPDLFPFYKFLVDQAQTRADWDSALKLVDEGEKADADRNAGKRRNDYDLRRAQLYAKKGSPDKSREVFEGLVARAPGELKYRGSAAEAMLGQRQAGPAKAFAEAGLAEARQQNNRDMEAYFLELVAAAKKQGG
ncbi:MAG: tetratricopeptide repeat protein [Gemmataceae bacterium]